MTPQIEADIAEIYKTKQAALYIKERLGNEWSSLTPPAWYQGTGALTSFDQTSVFLIAYGDQFNARGESPLATLQRFLDEVLRDSVSGVHILPFFPSTSDDGFSITDYRKVNPQLGTWEDIQSLSKNYRVMADLVLNHCSVSHEWFQRFLNDEAPFNDFFITASPDEDLSSVARPRALPLLHDFQQNGKTVSVWTTFSKDQVDLNFANPLLLAEILSILAFYITNGISIIRLDAVAYIWKETGNSCIHHANTHRIVRVIRSFLDLYAPWVTLISETNVPHDENISYFGDDDEAHLVYQFSLPPLLLHALRNGTTQHLQHWAKSIANTADTHGFFTFTASHDGIGLLPAQGIVPTEEMQSIADHILSLGAFVSYKNTASGTIPYELNCNFLSALSDQESSTARKAQLFLLSQALFLSLPGIPGIYAHSIIGSENWYEGVQLSAIPRRINREKLSYEVLQKELAENKSLRRQVLDGYKQLLSARALSPCFSPFAAFTVLASSDSLFCCLRGPVDSRALLCLFNSTPDDQVASLKKKDLCITRPLFYNLIEQEQIIAHQLQNSIEIPLQAYEALWLTYTQE